jgi:hypothetical protein
MNLKRAIAFGVLCWVLIFFEVSILMFGLQLETGIGYYIIHYILAAVLIALTAALYFGGKNVNKKGFVEGVIVGLIFVVVGIILDAIITVPLFVKDYSFFLDVMMLIGYLETIIVAGIVGAIKR